MKLHFSPPLKRIAHAAVLCLASWAVTSPWAHAQNVPLQTAIIPGERLSAWLLRNGGPNVDTTALHWQVQAERAPQSQLRQAVVHGLKQAPSAGLSDEAKNRLSDWLLALPLTGRLTVAIADARWLESSPAQDPILQEGHRIVLPPRPSTVTIASETSPPCTATHVAGALIQDYLRACLGAQASAQVDWAWIAQADGRTTRYGIAPWSLEPQAEPSPGAWIWAPARQTGISHSVSDNLARFLATQLPGELTLPFQPVQAVAVQRTEAPPPRAAQLTSSDWGEIGLLQTPTARMAPAGAVRLHISNVDPYTRGTVMFQPIDWLEAGFRYTDIANRLYGPDIAGSQSYKDKSIDLKLRLHEETALWPQIALGMRDIGGTGFFSGEYVVANKRWGNWDASLGLGWGYLGSRSNIRNPLAFLGDKFVNRTNDAIGQGGTVNSQGMFHGPAALFGGVQWHSPSNPWLFKAELDGNAYQQEPISNNQIVRSPLNFGAVYRYSPNVDFSLGLERGNQLMLGVTLHGALHQLQAPKLLDSPLPPVQPQAPAQLPAAGWGGTAQTLTRHTGWLVRSISHQGTRTQVVAETDTAVHLQERIDRAITVLHRDAPASSTRFVLQLQERGLAMTQIEVDRAEWVTQHTQAQPPALRLPAQQVLPGQTSVASTLAADAPANSTWQGKKPGFSAEWGPSYSQILGGPDSFALFQLGLQSDLEYRLTDSTWVSGALNLRLLDNFDRFVYDGPSNLPRVRTNQREYATASRFNVPLLQLTHVKDFGNGHYASAYAGMLESMYGGVGAEWLYRPWQSRVAWGLDVNHVKQRDFRQNLAFRDYAVTTGHATMYWDTGWKDLQVKLSAGRYLAGDVGATMDVKRIFSNGVVAGVWATKTNVSAEEFGEGSFDKGLYVTIPFDVISPKSTSGNGTFIWSPLTRDGGARLSRAFTLNDLTRQRDWRALTLRSTKATGANSAENNSYVLGESAPGIFDNLGSSTARLGRQIGDIPASTWLWAGGAVLASSLLDRPVDQWAQNHQFGSAKTVGTVANHLPTALALGTGLMFTGMAGQDAASTAETSIKAAAYTLAANLATRFVVGRARPVDEKGSGNFNGLNTEALQSGFASNHTAVAFALATPFAQEHNMPWLYFVAGATAFGRVQQREHWVSDTVGGALMGYAIGSLMTDQKRHSGKGVRLSVTPQSVAANWSF